MNISNAPNNQKQTWHYPIRHFRSTGDQAAERSAELGSLATSC
jgi:hypothetical protein